MIKVREIIDKFRYNKVVYMDHTTLFPLPACQLSQSQQGKEVDVISVNKDIVTIYAR